MVLRLKEIQPMLLSERKTAFSDPSWTYEIKFDGYRLLAEVMDGRCTLKSRGGADATKWFPEVVAALSRLPGHHIFDGEVCVLDDIGRSDFEKLHARALRRRYVAGADLVVYCAFDLLVSDGRDLMAEPLRDRKAELRRLLSGGLPSVLFVDGLADGTALFEQAVGHRLEGIVAKRLDSTYQQGVRSPDWLKIKRKGAIPAQRFSR